jgi:hypothetical protein
MEVPTHQSQPKKKPVQSEVSRLKPGLIGVKGLCVSCAYLESCTFPGRTAENLMHCEEFHCESGDCSPPVLSKRRLSEGRDLAEPPGLKGLCVNCDERFDCKYQRSPGGVWHCAEYQ